MLASERLNDSNRLFDFTLLVTFHWSLTKKTHNYLFLKKAEHTFPMSELVRLLILSKAKNITWIYIELARVYPGICDRKHFDCKLLINIHCRSKSLMLTFFIQLAHPCWIKILLSLKKRNKKCTDPKLLNSRVYSNTTFIFWINTVLFIYQIILKKAFQVIDYIDYKSAYQFIKYCVTLKTGMIKYIKITFTFQ